MKDKKFIAAVVLAGLFGMERMRLRDYLLAGWHVLLSLTIRRKNLDPELKRRRLAHCETCPIRFPGLETCGSPVSEKPELGCWCHLPTLAQDPKSTCWLDDHTDLQNGWKSAGLSKDGNS